MRKFGVLFLRVFARAVTVFFMLFFSFSLGYMLANGLFDLRASSAIILLCLLALAIGSGIFSFFRERTGGFLLIGSGVALLGFLLFKGNATSAQIYGVPFIISGTLHLLVPRETNL